MGCYPSNAFFFGRGGGGGVVALKSLLISVKYFLCFAENSKYFTQKVLSLTDSRLCL